MSKTLLNYEGRIHITTIAGKRGSGKSQLLNELLDISGKQSFPCRSESQNYLNGSYDHLFFTEPVTSSKNHIHNFYCDLQPIDEKSPAQLKLLLAAYLISDTFIWHSEATSLTETSLQSELNVFNRIQSTLHFEFDNSFQTTYNTTSFFLFVKAQTMNYIERFSPKEISFDMISDAPIEKSLSGLSQINSRSSSELAIKSPLNRGKAISTVNLVDQSTTVTTKTKEMDLSLIFQDVFLSRIEAKVYYERSSNTASNTNTNQINNTSNPSLALRLNSDNLLRKRSEYQQQQQQQQLFQQHKSTGQTVISPFRRSEHLPVSFTQRESVIVVPPQQQEPQQEPPPFNQTFSVLQKDSQQFSQQNQNLLNINSIPNPNNRTNYQSPSLGMRSTRYTGTQIHKSILIPSMRRMRDDDDQYRESQLRHENESLENILDAHAFSTTKVKKICGVTYNSRMTVNFAKYLVKQLNASNNNESSVSVPKIHQLVMKTECLGTSAHCATLFLSEIQQLVAQISKQSLDSLLFSLLQCKENALSKYSEYLSQFDFRNEKVFQDGLISLQRSCDSGTRKLFRLYTSVQKGEAEISRNKLLSKYFPSLLDSSLFSSNFSESDSGFDLMQSGYSTISKGISSSNNSGGVVIGNNTSENLMESEQDFFSVRLINPTLNFTKARSKGGSNSSSLFSTGETTSIFHSPKRTPQPEIRNIISPNTAINLIKKISAPRNPDGIISRIEEQRLQQEQQEEEETAAAAAAAVAVNILRQHSPQKKKGMMSQTSERMHTQQQAFCQPYGVKIEERMIDDKEFEQSRELLLEIKSNIIENFSKFNEAYFLVNETPSLYANISEYKKFISKHYSIVLSTFAVRFEEIYSKLAKQQEFFTCKPRKAHRDVLFSRNEILYNQAIALDEYINGLRNQILNTASLISSSDTHYQQIKKENKLSMTLKEKNDEIKKLEAELEILRRSQNS